jgi:flagellar assembly factor FliW
MIMQPDLTPLLGEESSPIEFPSGLVGFEEWKRFVLLAHPESGALRLLQSLDDARVTFIVADPRQITPDYRLSLSEADARALQADEHAAVAPEWPSGLDAYCILSVQEDPFSVTANLLGPLVVNWQAGLGRQVILSESDYDTRYQVVRRNT